MSGVPSAIVIHVPEADPLVERLGTRSAGAMPAHVTLLYPFVPDPDEGVVEELRFFFSRVDGFSLTFTEVGDFPGVVWLAPEQSEDLRQLTQALVRRWPDCPAYGGRFEQITPHLTVARTDDPEPVREAAAQALPLQATATKASLWLQEPKGWRKLADLPFAEVCEG